MADKPTEEQTEQPKKGYGKRPLWQWIVLYLIIGGIIYYGIYYYLDHRKGNSGGIYNSGSSSSQGNYNY